MIIRWLENARFDLQALQQHIALDNSLAANRMAKHIFNTVNLLSEQPALGRHGRIPHTRELIISNTPLHRSLSGKKQYYRNPQDFSCC